MVYSGKGLHHYRRREKIIKAALKEGYISPHKWDRFMGPAIYSVGAFGLIMTIPQILKIWVNQNASGVSVISWASYLIAALFWMLYGFLHKEKSIIITYAMWVILQAIIVIGVLIYG